MPLRDHFRSPVNDTHSWDELHGGWPGEMVRDLIHILPPGFRAGPRIHLGSSFEVDVTTYKSDPIKSPAQSHTNENGAITFEVDLSDQDEYEVRIYDTERGRNLVAAIEIVSPSNKDRPDTRDIFVGKLTSLLQQGVCVLIVDLVSTRQANLYVELLERLGQSDPHLAEPPPSLYAVTLRSRRRPKRRPMLDAWFYPMILGQPLPILPLWLTVDQRVMLPLETSYQMTCQILGIT